MLAAYLLEQQGVQVTVFEKEEMIGGHCRTLIHKDLFIELGTVFCLGDEIKALLLELDVSFSERFSYRNFIDVHFSAVEQMSRKQVSTLVAELTQLKAILAHYPEAFHPEHYGQIHQDLTLNLKFFLEKHGLTAIAEAIAPHLSSFGFGAIEELPAFYAFSIFDFKTIDTFIRGEKLLFIEKGFSEVIQKLSKQVSDIRYGVAVESIEPLGERVKVDTPYGSDIYDKVLVTTKLPVHVIKDTFCNGWMASIETNPFISCAYKVHADNMVTTYYKAHLGHKHKIQFFHTFKQRQKTVLVAYAYGHVNHNLVNDMTKDIENIGIRVKHLICAKQWHIFPHTTSEHLRPNFYTEITQQQQNSHIHFVGSLVTKPAIASLYASIKRSVQQISE